jgi:hypothetical protein
MTTLEKLAPTRFWRPGRRSMYVFSFVELFIVLGLQTILIAVLLPSVHHARESARRNQAKHKGKQLCLATEKADHLPEIQVAAHDTAQVTVDNRSINQAVYAQQRTLYALLMAIVYSTHLTMCLILLHTYRFLLNSLMSLDLYKLLFQFATAIAGKLVSILSLNFPSFLAALHRRRWMMFVISRTIFRFLASRIVTHGEGAISDVVDVLVSRKGSQPVHDHFLKDIRQWLSALLRSIPLSGRQWSQTSQICAA